MTPDLWVPGVLIVAFGSAVGWWLTRRRAGSGDSGAGAGDSRALRSTLELDDLRRRRDELYARLRSSDLEEAERTSLEVEAARLLQELDETDRKATSDPGGTAEEVGPEARSVRPSRARTLLTGFAFGGATAALIAMLVFWAGRDATERETMPGPGGSPAGGSTAEQPHPIAELPSEVAAEVEELRERLASAPGDLAARKRLALLYLGADQYVPAFQEADAVLAVAPDDIDSLYVQGVVRMTMGQDDDALVQLDRVLELFPNHVRAMTVKGLVLARRGELDGATAVWSRALEIGGPQPQIENLLAMAKAESAGQLPADHPTAGGPDPGAPSAPAGARITSPDEYRVRVEAETIPGFEQTGVVFVALRTAPGGPPVAVRRIDRPAFPMLVSLGAGDMMMAGAAALPESGLLSVRLDQDGSVATRSDDDLEGSAEMSRGDLVTIVLE